MRIRGHEESTSNQGWPAEGGVVEGSSMRGGAEAQFIQQIMDQPGHANTMETERFQLSNRITTVPSRFSEHYSR